MLMTANHKKPDCVKNDCKTQPSQMLHVKQQYVVAVVFIAFVWLCHILAQNMV